MTFQSPICATLESERAGLQGETFESNWVLLDGKRIEKFHMRFPCRKRGEVNQTSEPTQFKSHHALVGYAGNDLLIVSTRLACPLRD
jgi:hypothetical protein